MSEYQSPFSWRYGSDEMRSVWSEESKRRLWRRVWVALADAERAAGFVNEAEAADVRAHMVQVDIPRALEIESTIHHDLMAELQTFAEQCAVGGRILHLGATSADIEDNADALRIRDALDLVLGKLRGTLAALAAQIEKWAGVPVMAYTHLQPAEPTTIGYRLAQYAQDLLVDEAELRRARADIKGKGFKGAVGTSASYLELGADAASVEARAMAELGLEAWDATTQVYPRKQDWLVLNALAGMAGSLYKFAFDLRVLQSPSIGELSEPFGAQQIGSSAMPFKRNPINAEKIDSLARYLAQLPRTAWDNAAHSLLERTLDDSANRRVILPEAFLCADELLITARKLVEGLNVHEGAVAKNMATYGGFAATERVLMAAVRAGADRQGMHAVLREHSLSAWKKIADSGMNPLVELIAADTRVTQYLPADRVRALMAPETYLGDAAARAHLIARKIVESKAGALMA